MVHISWLRMLYQVALFPEETWQPLKTPNLGSGSNAQATRVGAWQWRHNLWKGKVKRIQRRVSVLLFRYLQKMYWFFRRCLEWRNTLAEIYSTFLLTWTKTCYLQGENCIFWELQLQWRSQASIFNRLRMQIPKFPCDGWGFSLGKVPDVTRVEMDKPVARSCKNMDTATLRLRVIYQ